MPTKIWFHGLSLQGCSFALWGTMIAAAGIVIGAMVVASSLSFFARHLLRDHGLRWVEAPCQLLLCGFMAFYLPEVAVNALGVTEMGHQVRLAQKITLIISAWKLWKDRFH